MHSFQKTLITDDMNNFHKCGEIFVAAKYNIFAMTCCYCQTKFTLYQAFIRHLQRHHCCNELKFGRSEKNVELCAMEELTTTVHQTTVEDNVSKESGWTEDDENWLTDDDKKWLDEGVEDVEKDKFKHNLVNKSILNALKDCDVTSNLLDNLSTTKCGNEDNIFSNTLLREIQNDWNVSDEDEKYLDKNLCEVEGDMSNDFDSDITMTDACITTSTRNEDDFNNSLNSKCGVLKDVLESLDDLQGLDILLENLEGSLIENLTVNREPEVVKTNNTKKIIDDENSINLNSDLKTVMQTNLEDSIMVEPESIIEDFELQFTNIEEHLTEETNTLFSKSLKDSDKGENKPKEIPLKATLNDVLIKALEEALGEDLNLLNLDAEEEADTPLSQDIRDLLDHALMEDEIKAEIKNETANKLNYFTQKRNKESLNDLKQTTHLNPLISHNNANYLTSNDTLHSSVENYKIGQRNSTKLLDIKQTNESLKTQSVTSVNVQECIKSNLNDLKDKTENNTSFTESIKYKTLKECKGKSDDLNFQNIQKPNEGNLNILKDKQDDKLSSPDSLRSNTKKGEPEDFNKRNIQRSNQLNFNGVNEKYKNKLFSSEPVTSKTPKKSQEKTEDFNSQNDQKSNKGITKDDLNFQNIQKPNDGNLNILKDKQDDKLSSPDSLRSKTKKGKPEDFNKRNIQISNESNLNGVNEKYKNKLFSPELLTSKTPKKSQEKTDDFNSQNEQKSNKGITKDDLNFQNIQKPNEGNLNILKDKQADNLSSPDSLKSKTKKGKPEDFNKGNIQRSNQSILNGVNEKSENKLFSTELLISKTPKKSQEKTEGSNSQNGQKFNKGITQDILSFPEYSKTKTLNTTKENPESFMSNAKLQKTCFKENPEVDLKSIKKVCEYKVAPHSIFVNTERGNRTPLKQDEIFLKQSLEIQDQNDDYIEIFTPTKDEQTLKIKEQTFLKQIEKIQGKNKVPTSDITIIRQESNPKTRKSKALKQSYETLEKNVAHKKSPKTTRKPNLRSANLDTKKYDFKPNKLNFANIKPKLKKQICSPTLKPLKANTVITPKTISPVLKNVVVKLLRLTPYKLRKIYNISQIPKISKENDSFSNLLKKDSTKIVKLNAKANEKLIQLNTEKKHLRNASVNSKAKEKASPLNSEKMDLTKSPKNLENINNIPINNLKSKRSAARRTTRKASIDILANQNNSNTKSSSTKSILKHSNLDGKSSAVNRSPHKKDILHRIPHIKNHIIESLENLEKITNITRKNEINISNVSILPQLSPEVMASFTHNLQKPLPNTAAFTPTTALSTKNLNNDAKQSKPTIETPTLNEGLLIKKSLKRSTTAPLIGDGKLTKRPHISPFKYDNSSNKALIESNENYRDGKVEESVDIDSSNMLDDLLQQVANEYKMNEEINTHKTEVADKNTKSTGLVNDFDKTKDLNLLSKFGLNIIKSPKIEDVITFEEIDEMLEKAKKFAEIYKNYKIIWTPKDIINANIRLQLVESIQEFLTQLNQIFNLELTMIEIRRLINLITFWYAQRWNRKLLDKDKISDGTNRLLLMFYYLPRKSKRVYYCEYCDEYFNVERYYFTHRAIHTGDPYPLKCSICLLGFKKLKELKLHEQKCAIKFNSKILPENVLNTAAQLKKPLLKYSYSSLKPTTNYFLCRVCLEMFETSNLLYEHTKKHLEDIYGKKEPKQIVAQQKE